MRIDKKIIAHYVLQNYDSSETTIEILDLINISASAYTCINNIILAENI